MILEAETLSSRYALLRVAYLRQNIRESIYSGDKNETYHEEMVPESTRPRPRHNKTFAALRGRNKLGVRRSNLGGRAC